MATRAVEPENSVESLRVLINSSAVALSRPRVLLSQHCKGLPESVVSAMLTL